MPRRSTLALGAMSRTRVELTHWARAYIEAQKLPGGELTHLHRLWWAVERFMELPDLDHAEMAWCGILEVISQPGSDEVLGILGAGALEDLIHQWGGAFIERIENEVRQSARFRMTLNEVWESGDPRIVWARMWWQCS